MALRFLDKKNTTYKLILRSKSNKKTDKKEKANNPDDCYKHRDQAAYSPHEKANDTKNNNDSDNDNKNCLRKGCSHC